jgi:hypothetical protein
MFSGNRTLTNLLLPGTNRYYVPRVVDVLTIRLSKTLAFHYPGWLCAAFMAQSFLHALSSRCWWVSIGVILGLFHLYLSLHDHRLTILLFTRAVQSWLRRFYGSLLTHGGAKVFDFSAAFYSGL